jgi:hypothetical protein
VTLSIIPTLLTLIGFSLNTVWSHEGLENIHNQYVFWHQLHGKEVSGIASDKPFPGYGNFQFDVHGINFQMNFLPIHYILCPRHFLLDP